MADLSSIQSLLDELVLASKILAHHGVVDAFGHVSSRHPDNKETFLMSRNMPPALVDSEDIVAYHVKDASAISSDAPRGFLERVLSVLDTNILRLRADRHSLCRHAAIYKEHPGVHAVVHFHAPQLLPFGLVGEDKAPFKAVYHMASFLGSEPAPIFDIADKFGAKTNMLVTSMEHGLEMAAKLRVTGDASTDQPLVLMRGHGATVVADNLKAVVFRAIYSLRNAEISYQAMQLCNGDCTNIRFLSKEEAAGATQAMSGQMERPWSLWVSQISQHGGSSS